MTDETNAMSADELRALAHLITISTLSELKDMAKEAGLTVHGRAKEDLVRKQLREHYGLSQEHDLPQLPQIRPKDGDNAIFPPYSVGTSGIWEGRRWRGMLRRGSDTAKNARAEGFSWNGKHTYWVAYDQTSCIPEPIYHRIKACDQHIPRQTQNEAGEVTTTWERSSKYIWEDMGIDPATKDRAGSLTEWYQMRGPEWFGRRSLRELQQIAVRVDVDHLDKRDRKPIPEDDLRAALLTFFFGYADAQAA